MLGKNPWPGIVCRILEVLEDTFLTSNLNKPRSPDEAKRNPGALNWFAEVPFDRTIPAPIRRQNSTANIAMK